LDKYASALWSDILNSRRHRFYSPGDLPLLREYSYTVAMLLPRVNAALEDDADFKRLDARDKLVRLAGSLAGELRICVSSHRRPDTAKMRDSVREGSEQWNFGASANP
jgi:hypothetical protein